MKVEVWTRAFRRCVWRGELAGRPAAGDAICIDDESVDEVRSVLWMARTDVVRIELVATAEECTLPEVRA